MADISKLCIVNTQVRELDLPLGAYNSKITDKRGALPPIESVRLMPGMNLPMFSASIGQSRRTLTEAEIKVVLESSHMKRLVETGTIVLADSLGDISVNERSRIAKTTSDTTVLEAWAGQETNERVKADIAAQLAEIQVTRPDGDYRDVRGARPGDQASPGF